MPNSSIAITPGAGANADTFTQSGGDHRQAVVVGDADAANTVAVDTSGRITSTVYTPDATASGTITVTDAVVAAPAGAGATVAGASTAGSLVALLATGGNSAWTVAISGLTSGSLYFEASLDSTTGTDGNWIAVNGRQTGIINSTENYVTTTNGVFRGNLAAAKYVRVRSVGALTGTPAVVLRASSGVGAVFLNAAIPAGTNLIGRVQRSIDSGRNQTNFFHAAPIITTAAEVMQTLTGYKSGAAVAATATPAVVTAGKTYRVTRVTITYIAVATVGSALVRLRANPAGLAVVGSPLVMNWQVGQPAVPTAGAAMTYTFDYPEGLEFAAGTGIAVGVVGMGAVPTTGTIVGYVLLSIEGNEF